jgi:hypothetical protein
VKEEQVARSDKKIGCWAEQREESRGNGSGGGGGGGAREGRKAREGGRRLMKI